MIRVRRSTIIDAPVEEVWRIIRDFNGHERWHPAVAESRIEEGRASDEAGCVRRFRLQDGAELREQLLSLSDRDRRLSYCILDAPLPLIDYVATMALKPVTDGDRTYWEWSSSFAAPEDRADELAALVGEGIYETGFAAIRALFGQAELPRAAPRSTRMAVPQTDHRSLDGGAIVIERFGGPEVLRWQRSTALPPGPGEVRLKHTAIGLNYIDV